MTTRSLIEFDRYVVDESSPTTQPHPTHTTPVRRGRVRLNPTNPPTQRTPPLWIRRCSDPFEICWAKVKSEFSSWSLMFFINCLSKCTPHTLNCALWWHKNSRQQCIHMTDKKKTSALLHYIITRQQKHKHNFSVLKTTECRCRLMMWIHCVCLILFVCCSISPICCLFINDVCFQQTTTVREMSKHVGPSNGETENAGRENDWSSKPSAWKCKTWNCNMKMQDLKRYRQVNTRVVP